MVDLVEKTAAFQEATVQKTPTADKDVVTKDYADGLLGVNLEAVETHIIPAIDETYDLGSQAKKWSNVYAAIAVLSTMLVLGGIAFWDDAVNNRLIINGSLYVNGSIEADQNITAQFYYGDGSQLTGVTGTGGGNSSEEMRIAINNSGGYNISITGTLDGYEGADLIDVYTNSSFELSEIPVNGNITVPLGMHVCFGNCSHATITANSTTLIIKVN